MEDHVEGGGGEVCSSGFPEIMTRSVTSCIYVGGGGGGIVPAFSLEDLMKHTNQYPLHPPETQAGGLNVGLRLPGHSQPGTPGDNPFLVPSPWQSFGHLPPADSLKLGTSQVQEVLYNCMWVLL